MEIYVVKPGDTIGSIARQYGLEQSRIVLDNQLLEPYTLAIGQALYLATSTPAPAKSILVGGYAYPFISDWVLDQTLPYLTDLSIFSYGFTADGSLIPPTLDPEKLLRAAATKQVRSFLTLTPFDETGNFNNVLIQKLVNSGEAISKLLQELSTEMNTRGYKGINIDFEFILADDKDAFTAFVKQVQVAMSALGYETTVALAPKTSDDQQGVVYVGKDYGALGAVADAVLLMTYEWGYTYGPPMAVAPINQVRKVVEYALTKIPAQKIDLGIPNYGYNWPIPYVKGKTVADTINNVQAVRIAIERGSTIQFDETAQSPHFTYRDEESEHEVWFEDVRSLQAKFQLIDEYGLRGAGYWQLMQWFRANWLLLADTYNIQKLL
ncbi:MAG: LysM peptidoglycan-binding domain-containing protein [Clostridium sp.]|nr:LysM peptidoglycan-binding domain-containing protein [Clostridium sp.]